MLISIFYKPIIIKYLLEINANIKVIIMPFNKIALNFAVQNIAISRPTCFKLYIKRIINIFLRSGTDIKYLFISI